MQTIYTNRSYYHLSSYPQTLNAHLPAIPIFNIAAAVGVPFVDKTVRIETLADAIVAGIENADVEGVQRVGEMEKLTKRVNLIESQYTH